MTDSTRWTVIRGAAAGDESARRHFAGRYEPVIRSYLGARWRGSPLLAEVDDATQDVFVACFSEGGALSRVEEDGPGRFRSYLFGVTRNIARRVEEKGQRRREQSLESDQIAGDRSLSDVFDRAWARQLVHRAARLHRSRASDDRAKKRVELLELRFGDGLPIREIAARWGADAAALHREYAKARSEFQDALREVVRDEEGGGPESIEKECERMISIFR
ncbi:MAG: sigma-70 family RNA polymerase sigma factor [Planctomycetota bacterium]